MAVVASAPQAAAKPTPLFDLLHYSAAELAVSSNVDNPRDFPEHLIDGKPETAWNGKTGDLVGGWVAFRLPSGVRVRRIELSAGFDKVSNAGDLFTMNHRVKRVRLTRDGTPIAERDFDLDVRTPQAIELKQPGGGGVYRIEVLAVEPGSKATWRELSLSELKVLGDPGSAKLERPIMPPVGVGDFPQPRQPPPAPPLLIEPFFSRAFPSIGAFCKAYDAAVRPAIDAKFTDRSGYPGHLDGPHCKPDGPLVPHFEPADWAQAVYSYNGNDLSVGFQGFAVKTPAGVVASPLQFSSHMHGDPGCGGGEWAEARKAYVDAGRLHVIVLFVEQTRLVTVSGPGGELSLATPTAEITKLDVSCVLEGGKLDCTRSVLATACYESPEYYSLPAAPSEPDWTHRCRGSEP